MKYLINFQVLLTFEDGSTHTLRSTYTLLEKEYEDKNFKNFENVKNWFSSFFEKNTLDNFISLDKMDKEITNTELKVGRITDSLSGEYETF